jgi:mono/diheme cytochrome c family protein
MIGKAILGGAGLLALACAAQAQAPASVRYTADIAPLLEANCATCHLTGEEAGGMSLVADSALSFLVNKPSQETPGVLRVAPGDPDKSYLVMKLEGTHIAHGGSGARMPFGGTPLPAAEIAKIRAWIAAGANP